MAKEAAKQCMRSSYPEIAVFSSFEEAAKDAARYGVKLFACEFAEKSDEPLKNLDADRAKNGVAIFVGSEGGFPKKKRLSLGRTAVRSCLWEKEFCARRRRLWH